MTNHPTAPDSAPVSEILFDIDSVFRLPKRLRGDLLPIGRIDRVVPRVDDVRLTELIDRFELDAGMEPAGAAYGGLVLQHHRDPVPAHLLGEYTTAESPRTALLACESTYRTGARVRTGNLPPCPSRRPSAPPSPC